jgi:hypothetical protein
MDCFVTAVSFALQDTVSREALCDRSAHARFEPEGVEQESGDLVRQIVDGRRRP